MSEARESQVALITGSSTGIGRLAAETVARSGHRVYASMRDSAGRNRERAQSLEGFADETGAELRVIDLDVTSDGSIQNAVEQVLDEAGQLDVVVNNAGHMAIGITEGFTEEQAHDQMNVNFFGPFRVSRAVLPHMRQRRSGLLIHITSIVGRVLFPGCALYCASKFAHEALAEVLHYELIGFGIESVIVEPGPYPTQLLANSPGPMDIGRVNSYESLATLREDFHGQFQNFFASDQSTHPQEVADAITRLIDLPPGQRPLRTVCGPDYGATAINQHVSPIQADVLRALGMAPMADRALQ